MNHNIKLMSIIVLMSVGLSVLAQAEDGGYRALPNPEDYFINADPVQLQELYQRDANATQDWYGCQPTVAYHGGRNCPQ